MKRQTIQANFLNYETLEKTNEKAMEIEIISNDKDFPLIKIVSNNPFFDSNEKELQYHSCSTWSNREDFSVLYLPRYDRYIELSEQITRLEKGE